MKKLFMKKTKIWFFLMNIYKHFCQGKKLLGNNAFIGAVNPYRK